MSENGLNHQDTKAPRNPGALMPVADELDVLGKQIVNTAFLIHKTYGAGLLESIYEECFCIALKNRNIAFEKQHSISLEFEGVRLFNPCRIDLLIENKIVVELKAVERLLPVHEAQLMTYMKLVPVRLGYLINFNVPLIKEGIKRRAL